MAHVMQRNPSFNPNEHDASRIVAGSTSNPTSVSDVADTGVSPSVLKFELPVSPPNECHEELKTITRTE